MPPQTPAPSKKFYFFYGHRRPSQNRPVVRGGLFSNRQSLNPNSKPLLHNPNKVTRFDFQKWDPDNITIPTSALSNSSTHFFGVTKSLSPVARFICDSFRKHQRWGPSVVSDLDKLRRVTPKLVAEVLKVQTLNPAICSKFFHWAGKQKGFRHDFASYNAFAYCLNRTNQFRAADQVPELMNLQGKPPTEKQFEILIRMHSDANRGLRVYFVYEKMKKFGVKPRVFLYNRVMDALVKTGHLDLALSVYEDFKENELVEESVTFMVLIKGLCKVGRMDEVLQLLTRMRANLCKPDVFAYTAMVKVLISQDNLDGCLRIWNEMSKDKVHPDVMAYGTLIMGLCQGNRVDKAYELFKDMKEKNYMIDRSIYGSLVQAFVTDGKVGSALVLLKDLMDSGYRADLSIYNALIDGLCCVKRVDNALKLFQAILQEGLEPEFATVRPILTSYAELGKMDKFCEFLEQLRKIGLPVADHLSKLFSLLVEKEEKIPVAIEVFDRLKNSGHQNVSLYNTLMEALRKKGEVKRALALFEELKALGLKPNASTHSIATTCLVEAGDIHQACSQYNEMREMSFLPSQTAYCYLAKGLCKIGEIDAAIMLVRECLANCTSGPMEFKYALMILHVCKLNDAQKVLEVLDEMVEECCCHDELIYSAIISGMCKHGTVEEARKVFSSLKERKVLTEANLIVYDEFLIEHMKKKTADLVLLGLKFFGLETKLKNKGCKLLSD